MDATANDVEEVTVEGYPTLKYFPTGSERKVSKFSTITITSIYYMSTVHHILSSHHFNSVAEL